jgi:hypothetical protein
LGTQTIPAIDFGNSNAARHRFWGPTPSPTSIL